MNEIQTEVKKKKVEESKKQKGKNPSPPLHPPKKKARRKPLFLAIHKSSVSLERDDLCSILNFKVLQSEPFV